MPLDCKDSTGGLKEVLFIEYANVESVTVAAGVATAINVATGKQFRRYQLPKETGFFTETLNANIQNGTQFYAQELTIVINKLRANVRSEVMLLAQNRLLAITLDNNGEYQLLGWENALDATGGDGGSGTAFGDRNGLTRVFSGQERAMAPFVDSDIIAALLLPAA